MIDELLAQHIFIYGIRLQTGLYRLQQISDRRQISLQNFMPHYQLFKLRPEFLLFQNGMPHFLQICRQVRYERLVIWFFPHFLVDRHHQHIHSQILLLLEISHQATTIHLAEL